MNAPKIRQQWILDYLKINPVGTFVEVFSKYSQEFSISQRTFNKDWKIANAAFREYKIKAQKAKDDISINEEILTLQNGLKSKSERLMIYQNQIDDCIAELKKGTYKNSKGITVEMTPNEKSQLRRTIQTLQSEISKIEGDYAPIKNEVETKIETITPMSFEEAKKFLDDLEKEI